MVEELKLAIKIDDATIEQSLLKQFANAQKMAGYSRFQKCKLR